MKLDARIEVPQWLSGFSTLSEYPTRNQQMGLVIDLARRNVEQGTGGPFGAVIFDGGGRLISIGVNVVESQNCSVAHAEMVAIMLAQQELGTFDLSTKGCFQLVTSTEPCAMCLGAIPWSGLSSIICGATGADAEAIGFNEGDKPNDWVRTLKRRGIEVYVEVMRDEAKAVLDRYAEMGGAIYNAHGGGL